MWQPPTDPPPGPHYGSQTPVPPRDLGRIISSAFEVYGKSFRQLLPTAAALAVPMQLVLQLWTHSLFPPEEIQKLVAGQSDPAAMLASVKGALLRVGWSLLFATVVGGVMGALVQAALLRAAAQVLVGQEVSVGGSVSWGLAHLWPVIWVSLAVGVATAAGYVLLLVPGIILSGCFVVAVPAVVVEGRRGLDAMSRSWELVKGHWWHAFLTSLVAGLILGFGVGLFSGFFSALKAHWVLVMAVDIAASAVFTPFATLVAVLLYVDLRVRKEGLTAEVFSQQVVALG
jgi:hypothetical protein